MKKYLNIYIWLFLLLFSKMTFATDGWIFWKNEWTKLKWGDLNNQITLGDIPNMIKNAIEFFIWIAWTISIIFIIIWAYQILFGSLQQDKTKWKNTILMALWGFAISTLAWFIVQMIFDNFS